ncbi:glycosyltransferase family protein [Aureliella helgolandensis]|uniref:Transmembrane protein n=1 Tax=Aureliella helgolandensis TaxID=2527968 RepID=A0A518GFW1_9BACT|nr:hypothetical protein [Aureliella helgolandensis]QDV27437.1 hypothetical protein Q31a_58260 [Aureliella helgolandensis]
MPISRDSRNDRRRRVLRDHLEEGQTGKTGKPLRGTPGSDPNFDPSVKRSAGYSQDVRRACNHRLVQLIPVRLRSFLAVVLLSLFLPGLLLAAHYLIYVSGQLPWYGHPLAIVLDASHPRSIAAWVTSQMWLLCLGATILTFQLRRHKLDDYNGEYRLWFWLVLTCLFGSIEASTGIAGLFASALDGWSQNALGWSGPAVVKATTAVLVGMLGLRLCSELKTVPTSVVFVLAGLVCWAASAALGQPELKLEMSLQMRIWLRVSLWLIGLTGVWLAALSYLRNIYIDAQHRFLLRGSLAIAANAVPLRERLRASLPAMRRNSDVAAAGTDDAAGTEETRESRRWGLPWKRKPALESTDGATASPKASRKNAIGASSAPTTSPSRASAKSSTPDAATTTGNRGSSRATSPSQSDTKREQSHADEEQTAPARKAGLGRFFRRSHKGSDDSQTSALPASAAANAKPSRGASAQAADSSSQGPASNTDSSATRSEKSPGRFTSWLRKPKNNDDADEFKKVSSSAAQSRSATAGAANSTQNSTPGTSQRPTKGSSGKSNGSSADESSPRKSRLPKLRGVKLPRPKLGRVISMLKSIKLPKLPSLRLQPPTDDEQADSVGSGSPQKVSHSRPLPGTTPAQAGVGDGPEQPLSKAEKKRLRRMQQQQNRAA